MYNDEQKKKAAARARKCLDTNYKHVAANIKVDQAAKWQAYAEEDVSRADAYTAARMPESILDLRT